MTAKKTTAQPHLQKAEQVAESWRKTVLGRAASRVRVPQLLKWTENESVVQMDVTGENGAMPVGGRAGLSALADHTKQAAPISVAEQKERGNSARSCPVCILLADCQACLIRKASNTQITLVRRRCAWYLTAKLKHSELLLTDSGEFMVQCCLSRRVEA